MKQLIYDIVNMTEGDNNKNHLRIISITYRTSAFIPSRSGLRFFFYHTEREYEYNIEKYVIYTKM